ncbi:unnamed protein product [Brassicogethes aeneus]|uniref:Uncharacterized protein n=1 Tax=Brassicogethes aeneus TaxID=1431903 RepID=A0A9P0AUL2_BRAAE|nr:unnamed protein product [Brassicogethes aeneus]
MSKVERKEFQETSIRRTVSPIRSSQQNLSQFDSNLDYLLEDLQNSVSRPGSSLGYHTASRSSNTLESNRTNSLNRITPLKSSNPVTEYSSDDAYTYTTPDGRKVKEYKKEKYQMYKSSGGSDVTDKGRMQSSINQLDSLLDDLQQVKKSSSSYTERETYTGADPAFQNKTTSVNRELHYGDTPNRSRSTERSTEVKKYSSEGTYGDLRPIRPISPSSRTSTLSKQTKVTNVQKYPMEVVETIHPDIDPDVLAHLDPNLRPPGNTKVTTTIKTYTYEIPGSGDYPTNLKSDTSVDEKYIYSPNKSITTPSKSFVYQKTENQENTVYRPEPKWQTTKQYYKDSQMEHVEKYAPPAAPISPATTVVKEVVTTRNYQPGYIPEPQPPTERTYLYNETTSTKNINGYPQEPPRHETYIIKDTRNTTTNNRTLPYSDRPDYPVGNPPNETYIYKESNTTNRVVNPPYTNGYPPSTDKTYIYKHESTTTNNYGPGGPRTGPPPSGRPKTPVDVDTFDPKNPPYGRKPNEPVNITYKYTSNSTTSNNYKGGYPDDEGPNLRPKKFPTDDEIVDSGPPKRLDDLMATIGREPPNSPLNSGFNQHEDELATQRKVDTLKRQQEEADEQKKEPVMKAKNVSGPPVYYPPGHEMFAKKEESQAGWRAEGGYAKGKGMYEYEASSKSKSKSKSGATVVPVCLPLCCGLPCALL